MRAIEAARFSQCGRARRPPAQPRRRNAQTLHIEILSKKKGELEEKLALGVVRN